MKIFILLLCIIIFLLIEIYRYIFCRNRPAFLLKLLDKKGHCEDYYLRRDSAAEELRNTPCERYEIKSDRGETLRGFYYPCGEGHSKKIVFIVHGYHSEHCETAGVFKELYHSRGFDIFAPDNTASGESGGRFFGYDVFESADCLKWLDFLQKQFGGDIQIILHGFSLGGGTVLKMSDRLPDCVRFVISDSGFIDAREILKSQSGALYGIVYAMHRLISGCDLNDSDVSENVKRSTVPLLIVHGEGDKTVPFSMAPRIYALCPHDKDFLFTPELRHIETVHYNRAAYEEKIDGFIEKYIKIFK